MTESSAVVPPAALAKGLSEQPAAAVAQKEDPEPVVPEQTEREPSEDAAPDAGASKTHALTVVQSDGSRGTLTFGIPRENEEAIHKVVSMAVVAERDYKKQQRDAVEQTVAALQEKFEDAYANCAEFVEASLARNGDSPSKVEKESALIDQMYDEYAEEAKRVAKANKSKPKRLRTKPPALPANPVLFARIGDGVGIRLLGENEAERSLNPEVRSNYAQLKPAESGVRMLAVTQAVAVKRPKKLPIDVDVEKDAAPQEQRFVSKEETPIVDSNDEAEASESNVDGEEDVVVQLVYGIYFLNDAIYAETNDTKRAAANTLHGNIRVVHSFCDIRVLSHAQKAGEPSKSERLIGKINCELAARAFKLYRQRRHVKRGRQLERRMPVFSHFATVTFAPHLAAYWKSVAPNFPEPMIVEFACVDNARTVDLRQLAVRKHSEIKEALRKLKDHFRTETAKKESDNEKLTDLATAIDKLRRVDDVCSTLNPRNQFCLKVLSAGELRDKGDEIDVVFAVAFDVAEVTSRSEQALAKLNEPDDETLAAPNGVDEAAAPAPQEPLTQ